jgi:predicted permease
MRHTGGLAGNIRYALRQFRQAPLFTAAAISTLALGIGGTTAIFTLIDAVMMKSLPVANPQALWRIGDGDNCCVQGVPQDRWGFFSYPLYQRLKAATPEFEDLTAFEAGGHRFSVRRQGSPEAARPLTSEFVTGNYFSVLGAKAYGGRLFTMEDDRPAATPALVLSHHAWQLIYGGDPSVVGSTLIVEGHPFAVVGVAASGFFGETLRGDPPDVWLPVNQEPLLSGVDGALLYQSGPAWLRAIGRLRPGASTDGMAPRLTALLRDWIRHDAGYPSNWMADVIRALPKQSIAVVPAGAGVGEMKEEYGSSLNILLAVCGMVLLIGCANVANLLLARSATRRTQTALRLAVGATPRQIVGLALTESVLLAIGGSIAGIAVAMGAARLLLILAFQHVHFLPVSVTPSPAVMGCALALALVTGIAFGAAPAWLATRTDPAEALRGSGRAISAHSSWASRALVATQACLSVVLVAGACMLARSLDKLENQNFGFAVDNRVIVAMNPPAATYTIAKLNALYRELEKRLAGLPGVRGAGLALYNPLTNNWGELIYVAGHPAPRMDGDTGASWDRVSARYLQNFGIPVLQGRYFTDGDNPTSAPVAVVNQAFVKRFFRPEENPIGQQFGLDKPEFANMFRIVGVVGDAKFAGWGLRRPARPMFFLPLAQNAPYPAGDMLERIELRSHYIGGLMLTTNATPGALEPVVTKILMELDPNLTITSVRTMREQVALRFDQDRAVASLAGLFGAVALLLAAVGLYGVTAYGVAQRRNEIGIRMALGADRGSVVGLVLRGTAARAGGGLLLGVPLAIGAGRLLQTRLYGVSNWDPVALGAAAGALAVCASVAAIIPARRAASIPAVEALRAE